MSEELEAMAMYYTDEFPRQNDSEHTKRTTLVRNPFVRRDRPWRVLGLIKVRFFYIQ